MIRYLKYELKKNFWTLVVLTAIAVIVYVVTVSTSKLFSTGTYGIFNQDPQISLIYDSRNFLRGCSRAHVLL